MSDEKFDQEPMTMDQAMAGEGSMFKQLKEGDVVDGVVVHIDKDGVLHCEFFTANGKRHSIICGWNRKRQAFTFRFRGVLWAYKP